MTQPHCRQTALLDDSTPRSLDSRPSNALTSSDFHIIRAVRSPGHVAIEEIRSGAGSGGGDLLGLLLLFSLAANVAQGAELLSLMSPTSQKLSLETTRLPLTSWQPWNKTKQKQEALPLPSSTTCCTQLYRQPLPNKLLRKITHVELQEADGDCHLQAIVTAAWLGGLSAIGKGSRRLYPT
ncbi:hypothetical protein NN561_007952 [Cricetulus griseus]